MFTFCIRSVAFSIIIFVIFLYNFLCVQSSLSISFLSSPHLYHQFLLLTSSTAATGRDKPGWRFPPHSPLNLTIPYGTVKHPSPSQPPPVVPGVSDWISPSLQTYLPSSATNCRIPRCHPVSKSFLNPYNNYYSYNPHLTPKPSVRELTHPLQPAMLNVVSLVEERRNRHTQVLFHYNDQDFIKWDNKRIWGTETGIASPMHSSEILSTKSNSRKIIGCIGYNHPVHRMLTQH